MKALKFDNDSMFWFKWLVNTATVFIFGILISFALTFIIISIFETFINEALAHAIGYGFLGGGIGALIGLVQWKLLRKKIAISAYWILGSAGGFFFSELSAGITLWAIGSDRDIDLAGQGLLIYVLIYTIGGALAGLLQRPLLGKNYVITRFWVYASALGWGIALFLPLVIITDSLNFLVFLGMLITSGLALGFVTGFAMKRILQQASIKSE